jgi:hypothetical protein
MHTHTHTHTSPPPQVFTITVPSEQESAARQLVLDMSPSARLTYSVGGTLKFELPTTEVSLTASCTQTPGTCLHTDPRRQSLHAGLAAAGHT